MAIRFGDILVKNNIVTPEVVEQLVEEAQDNNTPLGTLILKKGIVTEDTLQQLYVQYIQEKYANVIQRYNIFVRQDPVERLDSVMRNNLTSFDTWKSFLDMHKQQQKINRRTQATFTALYNKFLYCEQNQGGETFIPIAYDTRQLVIGVKLDVILDNIFNDILFNFFSFSNLSIVVNVLTDNNFTSLVDTYRQLSNIVSTGQSSVPTATTMQEKNTAQVIADHNSALLGTSMQVAVDTAHTGDDYAKALLAEALSIPNTTDMHLYWTSAGLVTEIRKDGTLQQTHIIEKTTGEQICNVIQSWAQIDPYKKIPQDGQFEIVFQITRRQVQVGKESMHYFVRVATARTQHSTTSTDIYLRFLPADNQATMEDITQLEHLGFLPWQLEQIKAAIGMPYGLVLVTGPTGSGKSTTLYAMLRHIMSQEEKYNIITVEDPVEQRLDGIKQYQINERAENPAERVTFASMLRAAMRMDPDIILVGEIRDHETADTAINAALTGHLVLATVHANTAILAIPRLLGMNISPDMLASTLSFVMAQRLLRKADGSGRIAIAETLPITFELKSAIARSASETELYTIALRQGFVTMEEAVKQYTNLKKEDIERFIGTEYAQLRKVVNSSSGEDRYIEIIEKPINENKYTITEEKSKDENEDEEPFSF